MKRFAVADEYGTHFETGVPVEVRYVRGTTKAPAPLTGDRYQQRIEPAGRYLIHNPDPGDLPRGWEAGVVRFRRPLVVPFNLVPGNLYDERSWKKQLQAHYKKRGTALSRAIVADGYDAVVTAMDGETREIVDLTMFRN